jgi:hypothetical protein
MPRRCRRPDLCGAAPGGRLDFRAFDFLLNHGERTLAVFVGVALRLKVRRRHFLDQAHAKLDLLAGELDIFTFRYRVEVSDLIFEVSSSNCYSLRFLVSW